MKLVRFETSSGRVMPGEAELETDTVFTISESGTREAVGTLSQTRLHAPCLPTKIVAVGVNYRAHAAEFNKPVPEEPLLFLKPPSAVTAPGGVIVLPRASQLVHHEAELALVIARHTRKVSPNDAPDSVLGFTCFNDVTARDLQRKDVQFTRGKGFDTFAPVGPWIETDVNPRDLAVSCRVNGVTKQSGRTSDMVWDVFTLVSYISHVMTLEGGDIITTGTPPGVGPLVAGDEVEVELEGIGVLRNRCVLETRD